ncbi:MFS transporter [Paludibacterium yongneupense]|uniref:MFS transporter n=1 Tax=Paludibacterium yongneupense TaxID=400061 RepID=UPI0004076EBA|nr:MFS transporter [Paludibacterium yongneupense]
MLERRVWLDFLAVTFSVALLGLGLGSTMPLTALVLSARGYGPDIIGWMAAATALGGALATFAAPSLTQALGRRRVMLACLLLAAASVVPLQYTSSLVAWFGLRFAFGMAMAPLFVLGEAWINLLPGDAVRGRIVAIYTTCFTSCQVLGPILTDWLAAYPQRAFVLCGLVFLLGAPGILVARDEPRGTGLADAAVAPGAKEHAVSWSGIVWMAPVIIVATLFFAAFDTVTFSFLPLAALAAGLGQGQALAAASLVFLGDATLQFAVGCLADRYGRRRTHLCCGLALCLLLPLLPALIGWSPAWEIYLFVLGGVAGGVYTLALVACGDYFSGKALLRASGLIALAWNVGSCAGGAATGLVMHRFGPPFMVTVLWGLALLFVLAALADGRRASVACEARARA